MDGILRDITCAFVYLDDILIASKDRETHLRNLRAVFSLLASHGISVNRKKCVLGKTEVKYLGHLVSAQGISPLPSRVADLQSFPSPSSKLALQRYLGMINYYCRFFPSLADRVLPLQRAIAQAKKPRDFQWTEECEAAFRLSKEALANAALLQHPSPFSKTAITVDASDHAVGAALSQRGGDQVWRPIAFFSKMMTPAERKYSAFDRELLAIYLSIKHFRHFLEGRSFIIFTDHKPLTFALGSSTD